MIKLINLSKYYGSDLILDNINLEIKSNEIITLLGPNGCGKTSLLKIIAGLDNHDSGQKITNKKTTHGFVFQNYKDSLLPWKTVEKNVKIALKNENKISKQKIIKKILLKFKLWEHRKKYPYQLSGGMSQLLAISRSLVSKPDILLLDEPFSSLDYHTTIKLQNKIKQIHTELKIPIIIVTHSPEDALVLSHKIIILSKKPTNIIKIIENDFANQEDTRKEVLKIYNSFL